MPEQIVSEYRKEFQTRLTERKIHAACKIIEHLVNEIFERCHNKSKVKNEEKDFILEELKQVAKTFKNGQSRDPCGYINELFKNAGNSLLLSLLFMLNEIKRFKTIPEQWNTVIILTMYKNKGSKKKLENYRGIFLTFILSKLLEKLSQIRIKDKIANYSSPFQAGSRQNRSTVDNLFLIRSIIDHSLYLKKVIHFTLYGFEQCFDSLWLKESMLVLWEAGVHNELFTLIYALNMKSNITVLTPYSPTEEFSLKDIVKQGTCNGPILCSTSTGQDCTDKYGKSSGVFIGTQKVKPAAFVDDLIDPNRTVSDIIESNENAKHFEKIKRLTFKAYKCKSLYINYRKEQCIELDISGETAENVDVVKYLGDIFNSKGNNNDSIESRVKTGKQKVGVIQAFCKEIALGNNATVI